MIQTLFSMRDEAYKEFQSSLIPTLSKERMIGVRTPQLRRYVRTLSEEEKCSFLAVLPHEYYEENNIHALILNGFGCAIDQLEAFLPYVDNWATCDMLNPPANPITQAEYLACIRRWLRSPHPYTVRYALNCFMRDFLDERFDPSYFEWIDAVQNEDYYVKMGIAWYYSVALVKQWDATSEHLAQGLPDPWIWRKALQKGLESNRLSETQKYVIKKIKEIIK